VEHVNILERFAAGWGCHASSESGVQGCLEGLSATVGFDEPVYDVAGRAGHLVMIAGVVGWVDSYSADDLIRRNAV